LSSAHWVVAHRRIVAFTLCYSQCSAAQDMNLSRIFASNILRYLNFIWHSSPKWSILSILLVVLQGVLPLITLYLVKLAVDSVALHGYDTILGFSSVTFLSCFWGWPLYSKRYPA